MMIRLQQNEKIYKKQKMNFREQTMTDTKLLKLEKEIVTLKNKIKESGRYKLREQVAALTKERDEALRVTFDVRVIEQLAAAQATNAKLREAMLSVLCDPEGVPCFEGSDGDRAVIAEALALPNDTTALDARLAQERKEIADTCDRFHERGMNPAECAAHIRSMT